LIQCAVSEPFAEWLAAADGSVVLTTYQAGKVVLLGWDGRRVSVLPRHFDRPMGLAVTGSQLALATRHELMLFADASLLARDYREPEKYDALYLPRCSFHTGQLNLHDLAFVGDTVWAVNTRFSCLCELSLEYSFVPRWQPPFITQLAPEDRCHLNGLALVDGRPRFVTALAETDQAGTWRQHKTDGGVLIDIDSNQTVLRGLCMPHSPRWHDGRLWLLNSGRGELGIIDLAAGRFEPVCAVPGYVRGLCFVKRHALVGLSQIRQSHVFEGLPVQAQFSKLTCGVAVIDLRTGRLVGVFEFAAGAVELYDVQYLAGVRRPNILNLDKEAARLAFTTPEFSYWMPSRELDGHGDVKR
jgi:uncharacterized protein (TIGR03032 family)